MAQGAGHPSDASNHNIPFSQWEKMNHRENICNFVGSRDTQDYQDFFRLTFVLGSHLCDPQGLLLVGLIFRVEPAWAVCKANSLPIMLSLWPHYQDFFFFNISCSAELSQDV